MELKLSTLAVLLGLGLGVPQVYGGDEAKPLFRLEAEISAFAALGIALMLLGTGWFVWYLSQESISDFAVYKPILLVGFAGVGIASCFCAGFSGGARTFGRAAVAG